MGMAAIPAGGILFRNQEMLEAFKTETPYLTNNYQYTFVGTRTGASIASAWAVFRALGIEGYQIIINECMKNAGFLAKRIVELGFTLVCEPTLNILAFRSKDTRRLADSLQKRGWLVSYIPRYDCIRIIIMPHIKRKHARAFLDELIKQKEDKN
jgi:tyrosine decarboxylase/aspartate 1-decarboxylase